VVSNGYLYLGHGMAKLLVITSGFGLYLSYLNRHDNWTTFFLKRSIRILPLYYVALFAIYFLFLGTIPLEGLIYNALLIQIYTKYEIAFGSLWFVSLIVQLYLLFPIIVSVFRHRYGKWILFALSFFLDALILKLFPLFGIDFTGKLPTLFLPLFLFGMLLAEMHNDDKIKIRLGRLGSASAIMVPCMVLLGIYTNVLPLAMYDSLLFFFVFFATYPIYYVVRLSARIKRIVEEMSFASFVFFLIHMPLLKKTLQILYLKGIINVTITDGAYIFQRSYFLSFLGVVIFIFGAVLSWIVQKAYDKYGVCYLTDIFEIRSSSPKTQ
jgi:peptidoglycan/LPS O-acetylase OafA/YrhL